MKLERPLADSIRPFKNAIYLLVYEQAAGGGAALARSAGAGEQRRVQQQVEVGISIHYDRVVAAQLQ